MDHFHLNPPKEWAVTDKDRFEIKDDYSAVARTAEEASAWLSDTLDGIISKYQLPPEILHQSGISTPLDRQSRDETRLWMLEKGLDVHAMQAISGSRIVHYAALAIRGCGMKH